MKKLSTKEMMIFLWADCIIGLLAIKIFDYFTKANSELSTISITIIILFGATMSGIIVAKEIENAIKRGN